MSGRSEARPAFQKMVEAAKNGEFETILVFHTSRFARNVIIARHYKTLLRKYGVNVLALNVPYADSDTPEGFLTEGMMEVLGDHYSRQLSWWIRSRIEEKRRQGKPYCMMPLGFQQDGERWIPKEPEASLIRGGFERYATGLYSYKDLARWSFQEGLRNKKGLPLNESSWDIILTNPLNAGLIGYRYRRNPQANLEATPYVEPIVPLTLWEQVQVVRGKRRKGYLTPKRKRIYVLSGVATCDRCGNHLRGNSSKSKGHVYRRMLHPAPRGTECRPASTRADRLETQLGGLLITLRLPHDVKAQVLRLLTKGDGKREAIVGKLQGEIDRLKKLYVAGDLTEQEYQEEVGWRKQELAGLQKVKTL